MIVAYDADEIPISARVSIESSVDPGCTILAITRCSNTSSPPVAVTNPSLW